MQNKKLKHMSVSYGSGEQGVSRPASLVEEWNELRARVAPMRALQHEMRVIHGDNKDVHFPLHENHAAAAVMVKIEAGKRGLK